jgi:hypothetical protein
MTKPRLDQPRLSKLSGQEAINVFKPISFGMVCYIIITN